MNCSNCGGKNRDKSRFCSQCGASLVIKKKKGRLGKGDVLAERYEILRLLKSGGMGAVYEAVDNHFEDKCAVKEMFSPKYISSEQEEYVKKRFEEEAKLLRKLHHNNLPRVVDYFTEKGVYYLVMDFICGKDLQILLKQEGSPGLPEEKLREWTLQVLDVLSYLHSQNPPIIYRDLKPGNIMIRDNDKRAFLIDFGIARTVTGEGDESNTVVGTQGYSPPEQYKGQAEPASDLYSLGATMHHLSSGKQPLIPFQFDPLNDLAPGISENFAGVIMKSLEKKVSLRYKNAEEMKKALLEENQEEKVLKIETPPVEALHTKIAPSFPISEEAYTMSSDFVDPSLQKNIRSEPDSPSSPASSVLPSGNPFKDRGQKISIAGFSPKSSHKQTVPVSSPAEENNLSSGDVKKEADNMIIVPEGEAYMGSKETIGFLGSRWQAVPVYKAKLSPFLIDKYPVTNQEFDRFTGITGYRSEGNWRKYYTPMTGGHPVINVSWNDANQYANWLGKRLPTQVEWERAARGTDFRTYPWGNGWDKNKCNNLRMNDQNLTAHMLNIEKGRGTIPAGSIPGGASPYGVMDMSGNVWEWCFDWYYKPEGFLFDPRGPSDGRFKMLCGGAWDLQDMYCFWCAIRTKEKPERFSSKIGFRCVKSVS